MGSFNKVFIGSGLVSEIFLHALIRHKGESPNDFFILGKKVERCRQLMSKYQIRATTNHHSFVASAGLIVLAVDLTDIPDIPDIAEEIRDQIKPGTLILSVTPNFRIEQIEDFFPGFPVIRLGLTLSAISGMNIGAYCCSEMASLDTVPFAKYLMESLGKLIEVHSEDDFEKLWNITFAQVTMSYVSMNCMLAAAMKLGLPPDLARTVGIHVFQGTAETFKRKYNDDLLRRAFEYKDVFHIGMELANEIGGMDIFGQAMDMEPEKLKTNLNKIRQAETKQEEKYEFHYKGGW